MHVIVSDILTLPARQIQRSFDSGLEYFGVAMNTRLQCQCEARDCLPTPTMLSTPRFAEARRLNYRDARL